MGPDHRFEELFDKSTQTRGATQIALTVGPVVTFTALSIIGVLGSLWLDHKLSFPAPLPFPYNVVLSLPILIIGQGLIFWCFYKFRKAKGTPVPFNPPRTLVTSGPYAHVRHPMVLGWFVSILGVGLLFNSLTITVGILPLAIVFVTSAIRLFEEPQLQRRFGEPYVEYKSRVPMFIPRGKRKS